MNSGMTLNIDIAERVELFRQALGFEDLNDIQLKEIACLAFEKRFCKGQFIFHLIIGAPWNANAAGLRQAFHSGSNVDSVTVDPLFFVDHIS